MDQDKPVNTGDTIIIDHIFIIGNKVTKEKIILRELDFEQYGTYSKSYLEGLLKRNEEKLVNTRLFLTVKISIIDVPLNKVDVIVRVVERWYLFPIPILELADRNFNDWWVNQDHDLSRIEWGLRLVQYNVRGMNETLKLTGQFGFTKRFFISYSFPYINRSQKLGLNLFFDYSLNKSIRYKTEDHRLIFLDSENWLREYYRGGFSFTYRKSFFTFHSFGANYNYSTVNDTIPQLNPEYYGNGNKKQEYLWLFYDFLYDNRDIAAYPLSGSYLRANIEKYGITKNDDVNLLQISVLYNKYIKLPSTFYLTIGAGGSATFPGTQPYNLYNAIGYGSFNLRGYELYVIEGQYFLMNKYTLRKLLFKKESNLRDMISIRQFQKFHIAMYLKTFADLGYVKNYPGYDQNTLFTDQFLYGGGGGLDINTFYDMLLRLEYSWNKTGDGSFVFGITKNF